MHVQSTDYSLDVSPLGPPCAQNKGVVDLARKQAEAAGVEANKVRFEPDDVVAHGDDLRHIDIPGEGAARGGAVLALDVLEGGAEQAVGVAHGSVGVALRGVGVWEGGDDGVLAEADDALGDAGDALGEGVGARGGVVVGAQQDDDNLGAAERAADEGALEQAPRGARGPVGGAGAQDARREDVPEEARALGLRRVAQQGGQAGGQAQVAQVVAQAQGVDVADEQGGSGVSGGGGAVDYSLGRGGRRSGGVWGRGKRRALAGGARGLTWRMKRAACRTKRRR